MQAEHLTDPLYCSKRHLDKGHMLTRPEAYLSQQICLAGQRCDFEVVSCRCLALVLLLALLGPLGRWLCHCGGAVISTVLYFYWWLCRSITWAKTRDLAHIPLHM